MNSSKKDYIIHFVIVLPQMGDTVDGLLKLYNNHKLRFNQLVHLRHLLYLINKTDLVSIGEPSKIPVFYTRGKEESENLEKAVNNLDEVRIIGRGKKTISDYKEPYNNPNNPDIDILAKIPINYYTGNREVSLEKRKNNPVVLQTKEIIKIAEDSEREIIKELQSISDAEKEVALNEKRVRRVKDKILIQQKIDNEKEIRKKIKIEKEQKIAILTLKKSLKEEKDEAIKKVKGQLLEQLEKVELENERLILEKENLEKENDLIKSDLIISKKSQEQLEYSLNKTLDIKKLESDKLIEKITNLENVNSESNLRLSRFASQLEIAENELENSKFRVKKIEIENDKNEAKRVKKDILEEATNKSLKFKSEVKNKTRKNLHKIAIENFIDIEDDDTLETATAKMIQSLAIPLNMIKSFKRSSQYRQLVKYFNSLEK